MKAILIDSVKREVREVEYDGTLESAYSLLRCELVEIIHLPDITTGEGDQLHDLIVDEEGLLTAEYGDSPFFVFRCGAVFAGSGLIVGHHDGEGNITGASLDAEWVRRHVIFLTRDELKANGVDPQPKIGIVIFDNNQQ